jgi:hypothetical protein
MALPHLIACFPSFDEDHVITTKFLSFLDRILDEGLNCMCFIFCYFQVCVSHTHFSFEDPKNEEEQRDLVPAVLFSLALIHQHSYFFTRHNLFNRVPFITSFSLNQSTENGLH